MKHKTKYLSILFGFLLLGCSEEFLNVDQRGAIPSNEFYRTDEEAFEALMAIYDNLQDADANLCTLLGALADEAYAGGGQRGDNGGILEELNEFRFGPTNIMVTGLFRWSYRGIYRANLVIDRVDPDTEGKALTVANAKFLRAFHYFYLVALWGDVPLVLHELERDQYAQFQADRDMVWSQIEKDLNEAIDVIPLKGQLSDQFKNLVSKGTVQAFLGKSLLFQEKYAEAAEVFESIIQSELYDLYPEYKNVLRKESEFGPESLFEISFATSKNYLYFPGDESSLWLYFMSPRETFFESGDLDIYPGWGFLNPRASLHQAFLDAGDTVRSKSTLISESELKELSGSLRNFSGDLPYGNDGFVRLKYVLYEKDGGEPNPKANNGTNIRMMRFADVLLMAAEAYNRQATPDDDTALEYVNRVRARVSLEPLALTGNELFEAIKTERRLELAFEFVRYLDLLRWGDANNLLKDQGKQVPLGNGEYLYIPEAGFKSGKHELLPFPEYEMNVNPNMVQNPGY